MYYSIAIRARQPPLRARLCEGRKTVGEPGEIPVAREGGAGRPVGTLVWERREGGGSVHGGDSAVKAECLFLAGEAGIGEGGIERAVFLQQGRGALGADALGAGNVVRRVAAQRDEIRHLGRLDAVAFAHLRWADAGHLAGAHRLQDDRARRSELEGVAVAARNEGGAAALLFRGRGGGQEVVGLV